MSSISILDDYHLFQVHTQVNSITKVIEDLPACKQPSLLFWLLPERSNWPLVRLWAPPLV